MFKKGVVNKSLALFLALAMAVTNMPADIIGTVTGNKEVTELSDVSAASSDYGLADNISDGVILHAWNWSFKQIKEELPKIAAAGFTTVQTSPAQPNKDGSDVPNTGAWWKFYQPTDFTIGNKLGSKEELEELCAEADKYGIQIIVDVVANHLANITGQGGNAASDRSTQIPDWIRNNDSFWHNDNYSGSSDGDRYQMTRGPIGMPDLNTGNTELQDYIVGYLNDLQDCGVDGFRFDAAKHIETPGDTGFASDFWKKVASATKAKDSDVFLYGEILNTAGPGGYSDIQKYTPYIKVTNNLYGHTVQSSVKDWKANYATTLHGYSSGGQNIFGNNGEEWVLWNESHDTYAGEYGDQTKGISDEKMIMAWCAVAARYPTALYFARPTGGVGGWSSSPLGSHMMSYTDPRIAAMNKFHNYFADETEYASDSDNVLVIERGTSGVALINYSQGSRSVSIKMNKVKDGTYTDQVTGSEFKVSGGVLTGTIGSGGVAAIYNAEIPDTPSVAITGATTFTSSTTSVKLSAKNVTEATYTTTEGVTGSYKDGDTITVGASIAEGESVTVTVTGKGNDGSTVTDSKTFTKQANIIDGSYDVYIQKPSEWGTLYCYAYTGGTASVENTEWPGVKMTSLGEDVYAYNLPEGWTTANVIFNDKSNQIPGKQQPGLVWTDGDSYAYIDGAWSKVEKPAEKGTVTVKYVDESGKEIAPSKTLTGAVGDAYTTTAATIDGYSVSKTPDNATGTYTKAGITVTYTYAQISTGMRVTSSLADGSTFDTETTTITLELVEATSGTYSVDNGPVKEFTDSVDVVIGKGKIADSDITVKGTITDGTDTEEFTFTYHKKFNGTVDETVLKASVDALVKAANAAASALASQYKTNPSGTGKNATITIDGSFSDWSEDMLIAQGAAWDVANHYKGGHENCVLDTYSLYAAWDDTNLYVGWQMVNTTDTWASSGDGPLSDGGRVLDVPLILALSIDENSTSMSNKNTTGGSIWGQKMGLTFTTHVDRLFYMSGKPGLGKPSMFKAVDAQGNTDYEEGAVGFADGGIEYKMAEGNIASSIIGLNDSSDPSDVSSDSADWVDYKTFTGSAGSHNTTYDSFYEIKIPLATLGIDKSYIENNGIGAMLVATRGESALDCIPFDTTMLDNATGDYTSDPSTSAEKDDIDNITVPLARIGKSGGTITPPTLTPTPTTPATPTPTPIPDKLELNFGADRCAPQEAGTALTLKGIAQGGTAPYSYSISVDDVAVDSTSKNDEATASWTATAGEHVIKCVVTDAKGNTATSAKYYTVEGDVIPCTHSVTQLVDAVAATCEEAGYTGDKVCTECNEKVENGTIIPALGHKWGEWVVKTPATTETEGVKTRTCATCEKVETASIPKLEDTGCKHENKEIRNAIEATCGAGGYTGNEYCTDCGVLLTVGSSIPKNENHSWDAGVVTKQPTITEEGVRTYTCGICSATRTEAIEKIPNTGCNHTNTVIRNQAGATCTNAGNTGDTYCADCGAFLTAGTQIAAYGHKWGAGQVTKQPTTTEAGVRTYTCISCGSTKTEEIAKLPETGCKHANTAIRNKRNATCTATGYTGDTYCADCNAYLAGGAEVAILGHAWNAGTITKQPTRTETGVKTYQCSRCNETNTEVIPATGACNHKYETVNQRLATCTQDGYTGDVRCSICYEVLVTGQALQSSGHSWNGGEIAIPATGTTDGIKIYTCVNCSVTKMENIPATGVVEDTDEDEDTDVDEDDDDYYEDVEKGDSIVDSSSNATYRVTSVSSKTVTYVVSNKKATTVQIPKTITIGGESYKVTAIEAEAFKGDKTVKTVIIGANVKTIGASAFKNCTSLTKVAIGKNVTKIGTSAFYGCKKLNTVSLPSKLTTIGASAFYKCTKLANITIPSKVSSIGSKAFYGCNKLKKITIKTTKLTSSKVGNKAFQGIYSKATIKVPSKKAASYKKTLKSKGIGTKVKITV